jgi:hemolysin III
MNRFSTYYRAVLDDIASPAEELANVITHGLGLLLSLIALPVLVHFALIKGNPVSLTGGLAFGAGLLLVYLFSTLYHLANKPLLRKWFQVLDHIAIYFLIAGTYTPFILLYVNTRPGYTVLIVLWALTAIGLVYKIFAAHKFRLLSTLIYLGMGWAAIFIIGPMLQRVPATILLWILAGGICYTVGAVIYLSRKIPYHHALWHILVLAGSICHFCGVILAFSPQAG